MRTALGIATLAMLVGWFVADARGDLYRWSDPEGGMGFCDSGGGRDSCGMTLIIDNREEPVAP